VQKVDEQQNRLMKMMETAWFMMTAPVKTMANANFRLSLLCSNNRRIRTTMNSATTLLSACLLRRFLASTSSSLSNRLSYLVYLVCRSLSASATTFSSSSGSTGFKTYASASSNRDCKALSRLA
jgi:hypothetical protein